MKELFKHIIYEHAINVLFYHLKQNLFSRFNLIDFREQYEQNVKNGSQYKLLTFVYNGHVYQFHSVYVKKLTSKFIEFEFQKAMIFDTMDDSANVEIWDDDESPIVMELDFLVESV